MTPEDIAEDLEQTEAEPVARLVAHILPLAAVVVLGLAAGLALGGCAPQSYQAVNKQAPPAPYVETRARPLDGFPYMRALPE